MNVTDLSIMHSCTLWNKHEVSKDIRRQDYYNLSLFVEEVSWNLEKNFFHISIPCPFPLSPSHIYLLSSFLQYFSYIFLTMKHNSSVVILTWFRHPHHKHFWNLSDISSACKMQNPFKAIAPSALTICAVYLWLCVILIINGNNFLKQH
jgi:hypothetical protein